MISEEKTVLVLGGGVGGLVAANELRKQLPKHHRVIMVERLATHLFSPSLLWLMTGQRKAETIQRSFASLARKGIEVVQGEITGLNPENRTIQVNGQSLHEKVNPIILRGMENALLKWEMGRQGLPVAIFTRSLLQQ